MKRCLVGLIATAAMCSAFPLQVQAENKTCFFPAMRLMNQNATYARKGPTVQTEADAEMYEPSNVACVPLAVTMIVRAVIENSKARFTSFKSSSTFTNRFKNLPPPIPTGTAGTAGTRLLPDFWDVSFVNEMFGRMDTNADTGTTVSDNNFTKGVGIGLQDLKNAINSAAQPSVGVSYREANATNLDFRVVTAKSIADLIQAGIGVALVLLPIEGNVNADGSISWNINPASHAVAVKGWTKDATADDGFIFKVHDPFGPIPAQIPPSTPTLTRSLGLVPEPAVFAGVDAFQRLVSGPSRRTSKKLPERQLHLGRPSSQRGLRQVYKPVLHPRRIRDIQPARLVRNPVQHPGIRSGA